MVKSKAGAARHSQSERDTRRELYEAVALSDGLDGVDLRVFLYLCERLNFDEPVHVTQIELAAILGRRKEHISRSIRALLADGAIVAGPNGTRSSEWMLNRDYVQRR